MAIFGEAKTTLRRTRDALQLTSDNCGRLDTLLNRVSVVVGLPERLKTTIAGLREVAGTLSKLLLIPIPAGPLGPVISAVKTAVRRVLAGLRAGLAAAEEALALVEGPVNDLKVPLLNARARLGVLSGRIQQQLDRLDRLLTILEELERQQHALEGFLSDATKARIRLLLGIADAATGELETLNRQLAEIIDRLEQLATDLEALVAQLNDLADQLETLRERLQAVQDQIDQIGKLPELQALLDALKDLLAQIPAELLELVTNIGDTIQQILAQSGVQALLDEIEQRSRALTSALDDRIEQLRQLVVQLQAIERRLRETAMRVVEVFRRLVDKALQPLEAGINIVAIVKVILEAITPRLVDSIGGVGAMGGATMIDPIAADRLLRDLDLQMGRLGDAVARARVALEAFGPLRDVSVLVAQGEQRARDDRLLELLDAESAAQIRKAFDALRRALRRSAQAAEIDSLLASIEDTMSAMRPMRSDLGRVIDTIVRPEPGVDPAAVRVELTSLLGRLGDTGGRLRVLSAALTPSPGVMDRLSLLEDLLPPVPGARSGGSPIA
ncbi:MAG: hypothetical protein ACRD26_15615 [Vicinamibacterales bacterium]